MANKPYAGTGAAGLAAGVLAVAAGCGAPESTIIVRAPGITDEERDAVTGAFQETSDQTPLFNPAGRFPVTELTVVVDADGSITMAGKSFTLEELKAIGDGTAGRDTLERWNEMLTQKGWSPEEEAFVAFSRPTGLDPIGFATSVAHR
jgi:hypothetical protein